LALGRVNTLPGRIPEAVATLEQARAEYGTRQRWGWAQEGHLHLAEAYQLAHRSEEAKAIAAETLRLVRERGFRGLEAYALRLLAEVAADADPSETEAAHARTTRPWRWPPNSACARSSPTANWVSASSTDEPVRRRGPRST